MFDNLSLSELAHKCKHNVVAYEKFLGEKIAEIDNRNRTIQALLPEANRRERILADFKELQKKLATDHNSLPLFGVLLGVKDLFNVDDFETRAGSNLPPELFKGIEAPIVTNLKKLGVLILGKTVTTEFAYFEPGPTVNPRNHNHTPGGSSSGSAAAIAADFCGLALGTQTIGSISRPASYCGVLGFKPSYDRVSRSGVVPFSESYDHIGFFAKTIKDIELFSEHCVNNWDLRLRTPISGQLRIGIPAPEYLAQSTPEVLEYFKRNIALLKNQGQIIVETSLFANISEINFIHRELAAAEMAEAHANWYSQYKNLYKARTQEFIEIGAKVSGQTVAAERDFSLGLRDQIAQISSFNAIDVWLSPASVDDAPLGLQATGSPLMNLPWTCAGVPTIALPYGLSLQSLPLGLQFATPFHTDEDLLKRVAHIKHKLLI